MLTLIPKKIQMLPIRYSLIYLWGTFLIFLASPLLERVDNLFLLVSFVCFAYLFFYFGYKLGILTKKEKVFYSQTLTVHRLKTVYVIIILGSIYFSAWGINQINDFSLDKSFDVSDVFNPGEAYKGKRNTYEYRLQTKAVNRITQVLIILSIIYAIYVPVLVFYWRNINILLKLFGVVSIIIYITSFLYIGTQKGIGDIFLFILAGFSVLIGSRSIILDSTSNRKLLILVTFIFLIVLFYFAFAQYSRALTFNISSSLMFGDISNTWLAQIFGESIAFGLYQAISYPTHGYLGLSYNLNQEFVFSYGTGLSQAVDSYLSQYFSVDSNFYLTYPARTEILTGWPAGKQWSTVFPWFASDATFIGSILLMFLVGFLFARTWINCIRNQDLLSFAILSQLFIFIAFIPANNQVLMQRQGLWAVISIVCIWLVQRFFRKKI